MRISPLLGPILLSIACEATRPLVDDKGVEQGTIDHDDTATTDDCCSEVDLDGDGYSMEDDCDDANPAVHPGAEELCDGLDNDCDGSIDEDLDQTWYVDADGDGFGEDASATTGCELPEGAVLTGGDCDDSDPAWHPGAEEEDCTDPNDYNCDGSTGYADADGDGWPACEDCDDANAEARPDGTEVCDEIDNDCDGTADEEAIDASTWYADADGDGYGDATAPVEACDQPSGTVADDTDCDDSLATISPGGTEVCNELDDDCDGDIDEEAADALTWYADADADGYGDASATTASCDQPSGAVSDDTDCDDTDGGVHPGADETCDGADEDCDGTVDEDPIDGTSYYADADGDGYGDPSTATIECSTPSGYVEDDSDCDDGDADINPKALEICDDADNDCDGSTDWGLRVPADQATIGDAISAASTGDTICVAAGTYTETIDFGGKDIIVLGVDGSGSTTIDGDGSGPVVTFDGAESDDALLQGFTITGGESLAGAGIYVDGSDPSLEDLVVSENSCSTGGSSSYACQGVGIYFEDSRSSLGSVTVSGNEGTAASSSGYYGYHYGIGIYADGSDLVFESVEVTDNRSDAAASYYVASYGAGVYLTDTDVSWSGGSVSGNTIDQNASYQVSEGGGIYLEGNSLEANNIVIADNAAEGNYTTNVAGGGLYMVSSAKATLTNCIVAGNTIDGGTYALGGAIALASSTDLELVNCDIVGNEADAWYSFGGGIWASYYVDITVTNTNVVDNDADYGDGLYTAYSWFNTLDSTYSNYYVSGSSGISGFSDPTGSDGNIEVDPDYTDTSSSQSVDWDLTLSSASSCIDAGDPSISDDDGSTSDIGAWGGPGAADW